MSSYLRFEQFGFKWQFWWNYYMNILKQKECSWFEEHNKKFIFEIWIIWIYLNFLSKSLYQPKLFKKFKKKEDIVWVLCASNTIDSSYLKFWTSLTHATILLKKFSTLQNYKVNLCMVLLSLRNTIESSYC